MGIFKKKREANTDFTQDVPQFKSFSNEEHTKLPELPKSTTEHEGMFPPYESEFSGIKKEIQKPVYNAPPKPAMVPKQPMAHAPMPGPAPAVEERAHHFGSDKPMYVRVDEYKEAVESVEKIKELCNEADKKLSEISRLRDEEDKELEKWQADIDKIKEKLLHIDKRLFEG